MYLVLMILHASLFESLFYKLNFNLNLVENSGSLLNYLSDSDSHKELGKEEFPESLELVCTDVAAL